VLSITTASKPKSQRRKSGPSVLLAHRNVKDEDEYLVQWSPTWEKGSPISNPRDALRTLKETRVKMWAKSTLLAPSGEDVGTAAKVVADAMAKLSKRV
jgi:hypothetical protein